MGETVLAAVAWPYANSSLHAGQIAGAYLPADIFCRYHRMHGDRTVMVSGSDVHGTPVTIRAEEEGITPEAVSERAHASFVDTFERFGIVFDLFTSTGTANHAEVTQDLFLRLHERGYIYEAEMTMLFDPEAERFLPDRYVEGTCPHCDYEDARGDQCDQCGRTMDALELIEPRSRLSDATPEPRRTNHCFLRLSAFNDRLLEWVDPQTHWRPAVRNFTLGLLREGLHDRAITRDIQWGRARTPRWLGRQAHLRLVRGGDRLPLGDEGVGAAIGAAGRLGGVLEGSGGADRLLPGQGQRALPHHHLAGDAARLWRPQPPLRRAGEPVRHHLRLEGLVLSQLGDLDARLPRPPRPPTRCATG